MKGPRIVGNYSPPEYEEDHEGGLSSMVEYNSYNGFGFSGLAIHSDRLQPLYDYVESEIKRFNFIKPPRYFIEHVAYRCFDFYDSVQPYALVDRVLTGIDLTDDWRNCTYHIKLQNGQTEAIKMNQVESYRFYPGRDIAIINLMLSKPGLNGILLSRNGSTLDYSSEDEISLNNAFLELWDALSGESYFESATDWFSEIMSMDPQHRNYDMLERVEVEAYLRAIGIDENSSPEDLKLSDFSTSHLSQLSSVVSCIGWAFMCYYFGPMGRELRMLNDIYRDIATAGECIIYDSCVFSPDSYIKTPHHPLSCSECDIVSFCVEICNVDGMDKRLCEKHSHIGPPLFAGSSCGTKMCAFVDCPNHPYYQSGATVLDYLKKHGQLHNYGHRMGEIGYQEVKKIGFGL